MEEPFRILHPVKYYKEHFLCGVRPDGRKLDKFRPVVLNAGSIQTADGSAFAKVGDTSVMCGIKAELCTPKPENSKEGFLIPNIELSPLCSPKFKPGPPSEEAQIATQLLADIIKSSKCLNPEELCLFPEKLAWCLFADLECISYDGSLIDACVIALITALKTVRLPMVDYDPATGNKIVKEEEKRCLNIVSTPICSTFSIFEEKMTLFDPTHEEESISSCTLNIVIKDDQICSVHKPGGAPICDDDLLNCIEKSKERAKEICELIDKAMQTFKTT
ncbi:exosome complex component RRP43-like [Coccinella septempunctata]|uniref:exosome complex component RRP43-like n=1 Tax=Coccinella septempunctata TaxID=41139 RepID=UPI001D062DFD|nr:exosome complex component RRP43-like [Coccinella septempunctata]